MHAQNPHPMSQSHNHHGRSRRAPRLSASQTSHRQYRGSKNIKEMQLVEPPTVTAYRARFEAGRQFEDDLEFCPSHLLDFDDRQSLTSGSSDRSSLASGSPDSSPTQQQIRPQSFTPALSITSAATSNFSLPPSFTSNNDNLKIHHPAPFRTRNAIPIVNPSTGTRIASPPSSVSPGVMQASAAARRW
jgi:hypothetical protein